MWLDWCVRVWRGFSTASLSMLGVLEPQGMGLRMMWRKQAQGKIVLRMSFVSYSGFARHEPVYRWLDASFWAAVQ